MTDVWSGLPILPIKHVLNQLSLEDVLSATSTCTHWRQALFMYEGKRESLKLNAAEPERSEFLTKLFKKNVRKLLIHLDCTETDANKFLQNILCKFEDTALLHELLFAGPAYMELQDPIALMKIKRSTVESMLHAHRHTLLNVTCIGCELSTEHDAASGDSDELAGRAAPDDSRPAPFLSKGAVKNMQFSSLQSLTLEYSTLDAELLESLCSLPQLSHLSLNLLNEAGRKYEPLPWILLENKASPLEVSVNIIGVPVERFEEIMENVLVDNLPLVAIRVIFCRVLCEAMIEHIEKYDKTLRVFHWADSSAPDFSGTVVYISARSLDHGAVNPFVLLCWRCTELTQVTIHGYWVWQYDLVGMARLRYSSLQRLDVSCVQARAATERCRRGPLRAAAGVDAVPPLKDTYVEQMNQCLEFRWQAARSVSAVHEALGPRSSPRLRAAYVLRALAGDRAT